MKSFALFLALWSLAPAAVAADAPAAFPLLGIWRVTGWLDAQGRFHRPTSAEEIAFFPSGALLRATRVKEESEAMTLQDSYRFAPPDTYMIAWRMDDYRRDEWVRFRVRGNTVETQSMEQADAVRVQMRRVKWARLISHRDLGRVRRYPVPPASPGLSPVE